MILEIVISRLDAIADLEWVITALKREGAYKISDVLFLESEEDIKKRKENLSFSLYFLLKTRVKVTFLDSDTSTAISTLGEDVGTR